MIHSIVVGNGSNRKVIDLVRDRDERRSLAGAIKGHLFPSVVAHRKAMSAGKRRAAQYAKKQSAVA